MVLETGIRVADQFPEALLGHRVRDVEFAGAESRELGVLVRHELVADFVEGASLRRPIVRIPHQPQIGTRCQRLEHVRAVGEYAARLRVVGIRRKRRWMKRRGNGIRKDVRKVRYRVRQRDLDSAIVRSSHAEPLRGQLAAKDSGRVHDRAQQVGSARCGRRIHHAAECRDKIAGSHWIAVRPQGVRPQQECVTLAVVVDAPGFRRCRQDFARRAADSQTLVEIAQDVIGERVFRAVRIERARLATETTSQDLRLCVLGRVLRAAAAAAGQQHCERYDRRKTLQTHQKSSDRHPANGSKLTTWIASKPWSGRREPIVQKTKPRC